MKQQMLTKKLGLTFLLLSISEIVKVGSNTFSKYEHEYKLCALYKSQTGLCKWVDRWTGEKNSTGNLKNHFWKSSLE